MKSNLSILLFCFFPFFLRKDDYGFRRLLLKSKSKKNYSRFYADWNTAFKEMDNETFVYPEILKYLNDKFYIMKFNSEGDETVNIYDRVLKIQNFK